MTVDPELQCLRDAIDRIDHEILGLLGRRVEVVMQVAEYKRERGLGVYDRNRERALLDALLAARAAHLDVEIVEKVFKEVVAESRRLEAAQLGGRR